MAEPTENSPCVSCIPVEELRYEQAGCFGSSIDVEGMIMVKHRFCTKKASDLRWLD